MAVRKSVWSRFWDGVTGPESRGGAALGAGGLLLHLSGVVAGPLWPAIVVGLYGTGFALGAWSRAIRARAEHRVEEEGLDAEAIRIALANQFRAINGRVPAAVMERFLHIRKTVIDLLPRAKEFPPGSPELFVLQQAALDYVPSALQTYLQLPAPYAVSQRVDGARTPLQVLVEELTLISSKVDELALAVHRNDTDRLLAHKRFLEDRFGGEGLSLQAPPDGPDSPPAEA